MALQVHSSLWRAASCGCHACAAHPGSAQAPWHWVTPEGVAREQFFPHSWNEWQQLLRLHWYKGQWQFWPMTCHASSAKARLTFCQMTHYESFLFLNTICWIMQHSSHLLLVFCAFSNATRTNKLMLKPFNVCIKDWSWTALNLPSGLFGPNFIHLKSMLFWKYLLNLGLKCHYDDIWKRRHLLGLQLLT